MSNVLLLISLLCIYLQDSKALYYVVVFILGAFFFGQLLKNCSSYKKTLLSCAILFFSVILGYYKYVSTVFPLGISFAYFNIISYLFDVYRNKENANNRIDQVALYVTFYPRFISGPLESSENFFEQLKNPARFSFQNFSKGAFYFGLGLCFKGIFADFLSLYIPNSHMANQMFLFDTLLSVHLSLVRLYFDFMGYSLAAFGLSKMLGINIPINFRRPYFCHTITEYWNRWHITLGKFFQQYVYMPIAMNKKLSKKLKKRLSLSQRLLVISSLATLLVFSISGLWHGNSLNFFIWGLFNAFFVILETKYPILKSKSTGFMRSTLKKFYYFFALTVCYFFFFNSMTNISILSQHFLDSFTQMHFFNPDIWLQLWKTSLKKTIFPHVSIIVLYFIISYFILESTLEKKNKDLENLTDNWNSFVRLMLGAFLIFSFLSIVFTDSTQFIYQKF